MEGRISLLHRRAQYVREQMGKRGILPYFQEGFYSNALTTFSLDGVVDFSVLREHLRSHGYIIYGGKGPLKDRVVQVATMGALSDADINGFLSAWDSL